MSPKGVADVEEAASFGEDEHDAAGGPLHTYSSQSEKVLPSDVSPRQGSPSGSSVDSPMPEEVPHVAEVVEDFASASAA